MIVTQCDIKKLLFNFLDSSYELFIQHNPTRSIASEQEDLLEGNTVSICLIVSRVEVILLRCMEFQLVQRFF